MIENLRAIDALDQRVFQLNLEVKKAAQRVTDLKSEKAQLENTLAERIKKVQERELNVRNLDLALKDSNSQLDKAKSQRMNAANQKMLDSIDARIQTIQNKLNSEEEEWLMASEDLEEMQSQLQALEVKTSTRLKQIEAEIEHCSDQTQTAQRNIKECLEERPMYLDGLESEVLEIYEKVRSRDAVKRVICAMSEDHCPVCRMQLSGNIFESIRHGGQVEKCPHCSMVLYFDSEA